MHGGGGWAMQSYGFFDVFRIPVKKGRVFTDHDTAEAPPVKEDIDRCTCVSVQKRESALTTISPSPAAGEAT